ncbi:LysR family transcriptional regulator [Teredinibacter purpureus]|uniref:LysR family transcriptional regulator n=1 Tax=Teredinibacter purpureus TaxID=2731756 RepID=UPI0005F87BBA|nr:LysR family transcriptional regulator [Teredinibacter purpureus]
MKITLEQWQTFKTVIDEGSFARAAEALNKSQSSVSYIIARLQEQLPIAPLVQRGRKAELTEAGKVLYRHAASLLTEAEQLEKTATYLASGWETEVAIAADALTPLKQLLCGLQDFSSQSPSTRIRLYETTLSGTDEALITRQADIAISGNIPPGFLSTPLQHITMVPVAGSHHPLVRRSHVSEKDLKNHRQIVVRDSGLKREQDAGWLGADQRWTVSSFATSIEAVKSDLGFAFLPLHIVQSSLDNGELIRLNMRTGGERHIPLYLIVGDQSNAGPAVQAVAEKLVLHLTNAHPT